MEILGKCLASFRHLFVYVATAIELGAMAFLTFDWIQKKLAEAEGLVVPV